MQYSDNWARKAVWTINITTMSRFTLILITFFILYSLTRAQEITNVHFEQEGKVINIYYDLSGESTYEVKAFCSGDGGKTWGQPLKFVTGEVGKDIKAGTDKKIVWNVLDEKEDLQGTVQFKIEALFGNQTGTFVDERDGRTYKWVKIGNQVWMAENLNYQTDYNSYCYEDNTTNCYYYGRLYNWSEATTACPKGWHLPSDDEWCEMTKTLDETVNCNKIGWSGSDVGYKIKSAFIWNLSSKYSNISGFNALPGGYRSGIGTYKYLCEEGYFWSLSKMTEYEAWSRNLNSDSGKIQRTYNYKVSSYSVRCLKDL
jgi:uncharacterized protein (TIGR02145 family)